MTLHNGLCSNYDIMLCSRRQLYMGTQERREVSPYSVCILISYQEGAKCQTEEGERRGLAFRERKKGVLLIPKLSAYIFILITLRENTRARALLSSQADREYFG